MPFNFYWIDEYLGYKDGLSVLGYLLRMFWFCSQYHSLRQNATYLPTIHLKKQNVIDENMLWNIWMVVVTRIEMKLSMECVI